jgi:hypothetical protein
MSEALIPDRHFHPLEDESAGTDFDGGTEGLSFRESCEEGSPPQSPGRDDAAGAVPNHDGASPAPQQAPQQTSDDSFIGTQSVTITSGQGNGELARAAREIAVKTLRSQSISQYATASGSASTALIEESAVGISLTSMFEAPKRADSVDVHAELRDLRSRLAALERLSAAASCLDSAPPDVAAVPRTAFELPGRPTNRPQPLRGDFGFGNAALACKPRSPEENAAQEPSSRSPSPRPSPIPSPTQKQSSSRGSRFVDTQPPGLACWRYFDIASLCAACPTRPRFPI